jgi:hypothetical protein
MMTDNLNKAIEQAIINNGVGATAMELCNALAVLASQHGDIDHHSTKGDVKVRSNTPLSPKRAVGRDSVIRVAKFHLGAFDIYRKHFTEAASAIENDVVTHSELDAMMVPAVNMLEEVEKMIQSITNKRKID